MPRMPNSRLHPFLVPYSSYPIHRPHPYVCSSPLPDSRKPFFINGTRYNWRFSYHHRSCHFSHFNRKIFQRYSLRNHLSYQILQQSQNCPQEIEYGLGLYFRFGSIPHDGHVRSRFSGSAQSWLGNTRSELVM